MNVPGRQIGLNSRSLQLQGERGAPTRMTTLEVRSSVQYDIRVACIVACNEQALAAHGTLSYLRVERLVLPLNVVSPPPSPSSGFGAALLAM